MFFEEKEPRAEGEMLGFRSGHGLFAVGVAVQLAVVSAAFFEPFNVSYDHRALLIGGKRRMLISAGIHYPRATPEVSSSLLPSQRPEILPIV